MKGNNKSNIEKWVSPAVQALGRYSVADAQGLLKLDAMENPYTLPEVLQQQWAKRLQDIAVNRYPCAHSTEIKEALRQQFSLGSLPILLGNGSDDLIQMIAILVGGKDRTFVFPEPSFSMYRQICLVTDTNYITVPLCSDFSLDAKKFLQVVEQHDPACVFLAYPNNPTGNCFDDSVIKKILDTATGLVVIDEAYFAFSGKTFLSELVSYPNLLILRTLSKSGLAGLRFGFMVGDARWLQQLEKVRLPYNINSLTQESVAFFIDNYEIFQQQGLQIIGNRQNLMRQLRALSGLEVYDSCANFVLVRSQSKYGDLQEKLVARGILIKSLHQMGTALENCYRITVGSDAECEQTIQALQEIIS